ncbi:MAG TPA: GH25 family lysozyme [Methylocella sp.]|nr:GH25 family lysozyme [Methylocella sp.]
MRSLPQWFLVLGSFAWLGLPLLAGGCAGGVTGGDDLLPTPADYEIGGIDVSKYQGDIDWNSVHGAGVRFAWIKATEGGDRVDEKFAQNWAAAKTAGVPRGAYHFAYWCRPMEEQAAWFTANVPNDPDALPPVLDVEWNGQSKTCPKRIPREIALAQMKVMLAAMERAYGKKPVIYTSIDFHRDVMQGEFNDYPVWVRSVKCHPSLKYANRRWHFWQHTAEGHVPGIRGYVDRNAFNGSAKDWQVWLANNKSLAENRTSPQPPESVSIALAKGT